MMHIKELIVVMGLAIAIFVAAKPVCLRFMRLEDFVLRRNVWIALTACAFLSPSFWIYVLVAVLVLAWAAQRDSNLPALYLVVFSVIPPTIKIYLPVVGINQLFALDQARILSLVLLVPAAVRLFNANHDGLARKWTVLDGLLVAYIVLQVVLVMPYETSTNTMRRAFLLVIDTLVVYYVFSRTLVTKRTLVDAMAAFVMVGAIYASIGIFESFKGWLMYEQIGPDWGSASVIFSFLERGGFLRGQASAGHSLTLGYTLSVVLGFWLFLRARVESPSARMAITALIVVGIYATHSRGPWLTAVVVYFAWLFLSPGGRSAFFKGIGIFVAAAGLFALTPMGERVINTLPFIGTAEQGTVEYRQRLATESWRLILQNPVFGDPFVLAKMDDLKQGTNFVDLMNAYAGVALFSGFVGATLFTLFFLVATGKGYRILAKLRSISPEVSGIGAALVACMIGSLFFMATASIDWVEYVLVGLLSGYASLYALQRDPALIPAGAAQNAAATSGLAYSKT